MSEFYATAITINITRNAQGLPIKYHPAPVDGDGNFDTADNRCIFPTFAAQDPDEKDLVITQTKIIALAARLPFINPFESEE